jgi:hypothetical protein
MNEETQRPDDRESPGRHRYNARAAQAHAPEDTTTGGKRLSHDAANAFRREYHTSHPEQDLDRPARPSFIDRTPSVGAQGGDGAVVRTKYAARRNDTRATGDHQSDLLRLRGERFRSVMRRADISVAAKALYALLFTYMNANGACWPSIQTLASTFGRSERRISTLIRELEGRGAVHVDRVHGRCSRYRQADEVGVCGPSAPEADFRTAIHDRRPGSLRTFGPEADFIPTSLEVDREDPATAGGDLATSKVARGEARGIVEKIFDAYPRHEDRVRGVKAIKVALQHIDSEDLLRRTVVYAGQVRARVAEQPRDMKFVPYASNWYTNERWREVDGEASHDASGDDVLRRVLL